MISSARTVLGRVALAVAVLAALLGFVAAPAQARVFIGIGIPFYGPGFYPGPLYYPPPAYYAPPPVYYTPPPPVVYAPPQGYQQGFGGARTGAGQTCYAGAYVCPMDRPVATNGGCFCLGNGGQRVTGRAN